MTLLLLALLVSAPPTRCNGSESLDRTVHQMGALLHIRLEQVDRICGLAAAEAAVREVARLEDVLSSWRGDSELGRVNTADAGAPVAISAELERLLTEAGSWVELTKGAFDPAVGALVDAWDLRGAGRVPDDSALAAALRRSGWRSVANGTVQRGPRGWWLDSGGFGKGAALRAAAVVLEEHGVESATLDFGGQLLVLGASREIAVAHPVRRHEAARWLRVDAGSIATTSSSERFVTVAGQRLGHVLDPRTGRPVPAWGSVTVWSRDPFAADVLSTALFVMGPEAALEWASDRDDVGVLVLQDNGAQVNARANRAMQALLVGGGDDARLARSRSTGVFDP